MNRNNRHFNIDSRKYYYKNQTIEIPINRDLSKEMNTISRSIKSINAMAYVVRADQHTLAATRSKTQSTPRCG